VSKASSSYKYLGLQQDYFTWWRADAGYSWENEGEITNLPPRYFPDYSGAFFRNMTLARFKKTAFADVIKRRDGKTTNSVGRIRPPYLVPSDDTTGFMSYQPLSNTKMFGEFAATAPTREGIRAFAKDYGNLSNALVIKKKKDGEVREGDSFLKWQEEIEDISWVMQVWEWQRSDSGYPPDKKNLRKVIHWGDDQLEYVLADGLVLDHYGNAGKLISAIDSGEDIEGHYVRGVLARGNDEIMSRSRKGNPLLPAQYLVQKIINLKMHYHNVRPRLLMNDENKLEPRLVPESLIGAIWLQFYQAVVGDRRFKRCELCGLWEDATDRNVNWSKHPDCANRERVKAYHQRNPKEGQSESGKGRAKK